MEGQLTKQANVRVHAQELLVSEGMQVLLQCSDTEGNAVNDSFQHSQKTPNHKTASHVDRKSVV